VRKSDVVVERLTSPLSACCELLGPGQHDGLVVQRRRGGLGGSGTGGVQQQSEEGKTSEYSRLHVGLGETDVVGSANAALGLFSGKAT
jgi:hypothetical protein